MPYSEEITVKMGKKGPPDEANQDGSDNKDKYNSRILPPDVQGDHNFSTVPVCNDDSSEMNHGTGGDSDASFPDVSNVPVFNDPAIEMAWARRTVRHMQVYYNLLMTCEPRELKLTDVDDEIYKKFKETFPHFPLECFTVDDLTTEAAKQEWRKYIIHFKDRVEDPFFGCLLRLDARGEYEPDNTILGVRVQHLAIEIARNREGFNDAIYQNRMSRSS